MNLLPNSMPKTARLILAMLAVWALTLSHSAFAATEVDLYSAQVVVSQNANQAEQDEAISQAFAELIIRVTGIEQSLINPEIQQALKTGAKYLATFRFEPSSEFFTNVLGERVPTKAMIMSFDKKAVDTLLVQNRLPVWGSKRPEVLIWLADRLDGADHILSGADSNSVAGFLAQQAKQRGVPYLLPIMDLTDTFALSFADVYGLFSADIENASQRYSPQAILAGRLATSGEEYKADWLLLFKGERIRMPTVFGSQEQVVAQGIDLVAQRLSEQYALMLDPLLLGTLNMTVLDVFSASEFAELEAYLKTINLITKVTVSQFADQMVSFNIEMSGDKSQLADVLALDSLLKPVQETSLEAQLDNNLIYQWTPK